jgi:hypothetical protein
MRSTMIVLAVALAASVGFTAAASATDYGVQGCLVVHDVSAGPGGAHVGDVEFDGAANCL